MTVHFAAVVILYNPPANVISNISSFAKNAGHVYVFDNSVIENTHIKNEFIASDKYSYFHSGQNEGIAKRLNQAAELAMTAGFQWLLMMDQDSFFANDDISILTNSLAQLPNCNTIAIAGPEYGRAEEQSVPQTTAIEVETMITSGSLLNLQLFTQIGRFDEQLFIDGVDNEYCIRTALAGFKVVKLTNVYLRHPIGERVKRASVKTLFLVKKEKNIHCPLRCYYILRNNLYIQKKYKNVSGTLLKNINGAAMAHISNNLLYGRKTGEMMRYLSKAYLDFKKGKMGKYGKTAEYKAICLMLGCHSFLPDDIAVWL